MAECSVIIPTCNRIDALDRLLAALPSQTMDRDAFEVIVIDNGPNATTHDVVARHAAGLPGLRVVVEPEPGLHAARHRGWQEAGSDLLVYADDDIVPRDTWLTALRDAFADPAIWLAGGANLPDAPDAFPDWLRDWWLRAPVGKRALGYYSILDLGDRPQRIAPHYVWGCNFAVRRHVLEASRGFHPDALPSDLAMRRGDGETWVADVVKDRGGMAMYVPGASVTHEVPPQRMTLTFLAKRAYAQGVSDSFTVARAAAGLDGCSATRRRAGMLRLLYGVKAVLGHGLLAGSMGQIRHTIFAASRQGYLAHRAALRNDAALRAWVYRPDYLGAWRCDD